MARDELDQEPRRRMIDETGKRIPRPIPHFENGMDHDLVFEEKAKVKPKYFSFAPDTELRQNYLQRDVKAAKQFLGNHFKSKMQNNLPLSIFGFAIQHPEPRSDAKEKNQLGEFVDKAPTQLGLADLLLHETVLEPIHPRYPYKNTTLKRVSQTQGAFFGKMFDACHQQPQAGLPLVRLMRNQSQLDDVVIIVTNKCFRPRAKLQTDSWDPAAELLCSVFAAVASVGRPLIVATVARPEEGSQPWARQHPDNK